MPPSRTVLVHARSSLFRAVRFTVALLLAAFAIVANAPISKVAGRWSHKQSPNEFSASRIAGLSRLHFIPGQSDEAFLEDLERRSFRFFWENADPVTGLVRDRARTDGSPHNASQRDIASIASTGFGLTALCIAAERGWIRPQAAREHVRRTLRFFAERMPQHNGWFYHFVNMKTGEREWKCELSSIDTALLLAGILTARQYYRHDAEIYRYATKIYERIDFPWMLNNHPTLLSMGWHPESGFINSRWDNYSEHTMLYLMAIGSPTHPITPESWYAWERNWNHYKNYTFLGTAPLFTHQYSQAWVDYRQRREIKAPRVNYFENSIIATRAHREFCIDLSQKFPGYSDNIWGISASDSAQGYRGWGGPPPTPDIDGTVVPCAAGGSLMFTPDIAMPALRAMNAKFGDRIYGRYGFTDAFNPNTGWIDPDVIGIDVGITLLSAENLTTGNVWRWFMRNREIPRAMELVGLRIVTRPRSSQTSPLNIQVASNLSTGQFEGDEMHVRSRALSTYYQSVLSLKTSSPENRREGVK